MNYLNIYEDYKIVNEGFSDTMKSAGNHIIAGIQILITKLISFVQRLLYYANRLKKTTIPNQIMMYIHQIDNGLAAVDKNIKRGSVDADDVMTLIDMTKTSKKYAQVMYAKPEDYDGIPTIEVDKKLMIKKMQDMNKELEKMKIELIKRERGVGKDRPHDEDSIALTDAHVQLIQLRLIVISKVFTFGKGKDSENITPLNNPTSSSEFSM